MKHEVTIPSTDISHYMELKNQGYNTAWSGGEGIEPRSGKEAREFLERHGDADQYEAIFGPVAE